MPIILILMSRMRKVMQKDKIEKLLPFNITHRRESGRARASVCLIKEDVCLQGEADGGDGPAARRGAVWPAGGPALRWSK